LRTSFSILGCWAALLLGFSHVASAAGVTFTISSPTISGPTGSTVGFGYTITNTTNNYFQAESLNAGAFPAGFAVPNFSIFDFPEVAPNSTVTEAFSTVTSAACPTPDCGLFEVLLTGSTGQSVSGTVTISGEFFANLNETNDLGAAPDLSQSYSVAISNVPEPSSLLIVPALSFLLFVGSKKLLK